MRQLWWQIISSLDSRDEVVDEGFWKKNWGVLFSKQSSFVVVEFVRGFSFGIEWNGVVYIIRWVGVRREGASVDSNPSGIDLSLTGRSLL